MRASSLFWGQKRVAISEMLRKSAEFCVPYPFEIAKFGIAVSQFGH